MQRASLQWVRSEIDEALTRARVGLEEFAERSESPEYMRQCSEALHDVHGVAEILEFYGVSLLLEEMETLTRDLLHGRLERRQEGCEVLMRSIVQLPEYLEYLGSGHVDNPILLMPLLNDLRSVRGEHLLSENALFTPELETAVTLPGEGRIPPDATLRVLARKLRPHFHLGLVRWFRDEDHGSGLKTLNAVLQYLEEFSGHQPLARLWWVASAVVEALREEGLKSSVTVKRLIGQLDQHVKQLVELGHEALNREPPPGLLKNLLYYVACAHSEGERIRAVKSTYSLAQLVVNEDGKPARPRLTGVNLETTQTVADAVKDDLAQVKDSLDTFVRNADLPVSDLGPVVDVLGRVADTLGLLSLPIPRKETLRQASALQEYVAANERPQQPALMDMARVMLSVDATLDTLAAEGVEEAAAVMPDDGAQDPGLTKLTGVEQRQLVSSVIGEAKTNLASVKDAISGFLAQPGDPGTLRTIPGLVEQTAGSLWMLSLDEAARLQQQWLRHLRRLLINSSEIPDVSVLDAVADALVAIEYYLEAVAEARADSESVLELAAARVAALDQIADPAQGGSPARSEPESAERPEASPAAAAPEGALPDPEEEPLYGEPEANGGGADLPQPVAESLQHARDVLARLEPGGREELPPSPPPVPGETPLRSAPTRPPEGVDPEILEIFIEEAGEVIGALRESLPSWIADQTNTDALAEVRRSFHTLKGSGRLVGADSIGEFAWSVENLLNRIIDGVAPVDESVPGLLQEAFDALPELIGELSGGSPCTRDVPGIIARAEAFARGDVADAAGGGTEAIPPGDSPESRAPEPPSQGNGSTAVAIAEPANDPHHEPEASEPEAPPEPEPEPEPESGPEPQPPATPLPDARGDNVVEFPGTRQPTGVPPTEPKALDDGTSAGDGLLVPADRAVLLAAAESRWVDAMQLGAVLERLHEAAGSAGADDVAALSSAGAACLAGGTPGLLHLSPELAAALSQCAGTLGAALDAGGGTLDVSGHDQLLALLARASTPETPAPRQTADPDPETDRADATPLREESSAAPEAMPGPEAGDREELREVFFEEAAEILEASDGLVQRWGQTLEDIEPVKELQRELHTLKGGARMANITELGDISHGVESLLIMVGEGHVSASPRLFELVQNCLDRLAHMLEAARAGTALQDPEDLIGRIDALVSPGVGAPRVDVPEPDDGDGESTEPVAEGGQVPGAAPVEPASGDPVEPDRGPPAAPVPDTPPAPVTPVPEAAKDTAAVRPPVPGEGPGESSDPTAARGERERIRVDARTLDTLVNYAGEISIAQSRVEQQVGSVRQNLDEMDRTVSRLRDQLRRLEIETESQILFRYDGDLPEPDSEAFDPLEMDRFASMQQLSRSLAESAGDLESLKGILEELTRDSEAVLGQQARTNSELQQALMRTRMLPFARQVPRFRRIVRQTAGELGKHVDLVVDGEQIEIDRTVFNRMVPPLEHMLRNAIDHGFETPDARTATGKAESGTLRVSLYREGPEVVIRVADDGAGLDRDLICERAVERGLMVPGAKLTDEEVFQFITEPAFSTADKVTQISGRGLGMDVVNTEIKQLGGSLSIGSEPGAGTTFTIHLPATLAVNQALMVLVGDDRFAVPLANVEAVVRLSREEIGRLEREDAPYYEHAGLRYQFGHLGTMLGLSEPRYTEDERYPVLLVRAADHRMALLVEGLAGRQEIVVKPLGRQLSSLRRITGATILGDGRVVLILDIPAVLRSSAGIAPAARVASAGAPVRAATIMVVDDSITVRKVTERFLSRHGMQVVTAKDGLEALALLQQSRPDLMLLDIEMPRMDGFELATTVRNDPTLSDLPIIMITSRTGTKHSSRAAEIGVDRYLGKPYHEGELLDNINALLGEQP